MVDEKPKTARSYRGTMVDDNAVISINVKWLLQLLVAFSGLVYSYYTVIHRIGELERRITESDTTLTELVNKHIEEEKSKYTVIEEQLKWYESEMNLNPLSWKKKRKRK